MRDIELGEIIKAEDLIYGVRRCCYISSGETCTPNVSYIRFMDDTLVVGHLTFRYEYLLSFHVSDDQLSIITLTTLDYDGRVIRSDMLSRLDLFFEHPHVVRLFSKKFASVIKKYRYKDVYDKSIFNFKTFKKYMYEFRSRMNKSIT